MPPTDPAAVRTDSANPPSWRSKPAVFRLLALAVGLSPFLAVEAGLRISGWRPSPGVEDPYVGFQEVLPLFERRGDRYVIAPYRQEFFAEDSFAAKKSSDEFRIFCLGGSTVQGRPYSNETAFPSWLEMQLNAADAERSYEVVNCGGVSYASYRLVPILKECLAHQPDLFILYTGHNEFLEARSYPTPKRRPRWLAKTHAMLLRSRLVQWTQDLAAPNPSGGRAVLSTEVEALLDYRGGLEQYHRDDRWRRAVVAQYERNLRVMVELARQARVPVLLVNPTSNVRDTPPFKYEFDSSLSGEQRELANNLWSRAQRAGPDEQAEAVARLRQALQIDPGHAGLWYHLARCHEAGGDLILAREAFLRAKDCDVCPLRMLESMHRVVRQVAESANTPLIDVRAAFDREAKDGIPGDDLFVDHVHPKIAGHQRIAQLIFEQLEEQGVVASQPGWEQRRKAAFDSHLGELGEDYFARGKQRLDGLRRWSAGRSFRVRGVD